MPFYNRIDNSTKSGRRTAARLLELRKILDEIPQRTHTNTLLLATWNIREFDSTKYGFRTQESLYYIAEIISRFDLIAVQEVREDLKALEDLIEILGGWWKYIVTDVTKGTPGNRERMAFLYDSRKVRMGGLTGELTLAPKRRKKEGYVPVLQFARTPFIAGFKAGWIKFMLCTVHIVWAEDDADNPDRVREIEELARFLKSRVKSKAAWAPNLILLGDFNIFNIKDVTFAALIKNGFKIPDQIQNLPSNLARKRHYDQIAFMTERNLKLEDIKAGLVNFLDVVYRDDDQTEYIKEMGNAYHKTSKGKDRDEKAKRRHYLAWRTHQMSDHLPMWVELDIDFSEEYLKTKTKP